MGRAPKRECRSVSEFYKKASKFLKLEGFKKALRKAEGTPTNKKNDQREALDGSKNKEKRMGEDKCAKISKKERNRSVENKGPLPK